MNITKYFLGTALLCLILFPDHSKAQQTVPLYKKATASVDARVKDLLKRMTLQEKIAQMRHIHSEHYDVNNKPDLKKLDEYTKGLSFGCIEALPYSSAAFASGIYLIQKHIVENSRLGIPVIPVMEGLHGTVQDGCTVYPQSIALGSTFNPLLVYQMAQHIAGEMKAIGAKQVLAPDLDLARELRWGRVEETYGEDPFLVGTMGMAYVKGMRENNIISTPKHFVAHGTPQGGLNLASVEGGAHSLFSLYLPPFEQVIQQANPLSVMNCYSSYDGVPVTGSSYFLTDILRKKVGFKGYVYSDWGSISMLQSFHHTASSSSDAALQSTMAGVDLEAGGDDYANLEQLVTSGKLDVAYIDRAVANILYTKFASGLFEHPYPDTTAFAKKIHTPASVNLSAKIASESIVLLKNEKELLPLAMNRLTSIAVIGPNADQVQFGDYSWSRNNKDGITPLKGISNLVGNSIKVNYAKGCALVGSDKQGFDAAIEATKKSDVAIIFVGSQSASLARDYSNSTSGEGFDLSDLKLPGVQEDLIQAIHTTGKPIVVVLVTGKPFAISWEKQNIPAIAVQWYGGEQQGAAIAYMLFGITNPSGKLPVSFPQSVGHLPVFYNYLPTDKGYYRNRGTAEKPGRDYVFSNPDALWPFGYGLSYTQFEYLGASLSKQQLNANESLTVKVQVKNKGQRDGQEVVQLYVRDLVSSVVTPVKQLKAFKKVNIKAGETLDVELELPISSLSLYNANMQKVVEPGDFELQIGSSSNEIRIKKNITIIGTELKKVVAKPTKGKTLQKDAAVEKGKAVNVSISGTVRDVQATVLPGVEVRIKGSNTSVYTDAKGEYHLNATSNDLLQFSLKGYTLKEVPVKTSTVINIKLAKAE